MAMAAGEKNASSQSRLTKQWSLLQGVCFTIGKLYTLTLKLARVGKRMLMFFEAVAYQLRENLVLCRAVARSMECYTWEGLVGT